MFTRLSSIYTAITLTSTPISSIGARCILGDRTLSSIGTAVSFISSGVGSPGTTRRSFGTEATI